MLKMPPKNRKSGSPSVEPPAKRMRVQPERVLHLLDLPRGPLELIISKVRPQCIDYLHSASTVMRGLIVETVMHNYKSLLYKRLQTIANNDEDPNRVGWVAKVLSLATDYFIINGFENLFLAKLLTYYRQLVTGELNIEIEDMHKFLHSFYTAMELSVAVERTNVVTQCQMQQRRLIYTFTILNLLRHFKSYKVLHTGMNLLHWKIHIQVRGSFLELRIGDNPMLKDECKLVDFLTILADMLVLDRNNMCRITQVSEIGSCVYVYGVKTHTLRRGPRLNLSFNVLASSAIRGIMDDVMNGRLDGEAVIPCQPTGAFSVHLEVKSRQGGIWSNSSDLNICVMPLL